MGDEATEFELSPESLPTGQGASPAADPRWRVVARNRKVVDGWREICDALPGNCQRALAWLTEKPMRPINGRCYALRHKNYAGVWCYEVGSGERICYMPLQETMTVVVYYAGKHPRKVPYPPGIQE